MVEGFLNGCIVGKNEIARLKVEVHNFSIKFW